MNCSIKSIIHGAFLTTDYRDYRRETTNDQKSRNHPIIVSLCRKSIFLNALLFYFTTYRYSTVLVITYLQGYNKKPKWIAYFTVI